MPDIAVVKRNIGKMIEQGAPEADIDAYLSSEGVSTDQLVAPQSGGVMDFIKSIPRGLFKGATNAPSSSMVPMADLEIDDAPLKNAAKDAYVNTMHKPEGRAGRFGETVGETLGNPVTYLGPGTAALKVGSGVASSLAGEAAGQAAEGTGYERAARIAGSLVGGVASAKALAPGAPKAATPTGEELLSLGGAGYKRARAGGLEVDPKAPALWAAKEEQVISGPDHGFTGGADGTAPKTFKTLSTLQNIPEDAVAVSASNLDTVRKNLQNIASETQPAKGGAVKPTPDAAAAMVALKHFNEFTESIPQSAVMAGNAADYVRAIKEANGNYGAGSRVRDFDARLSRAQNAADRQIAGSAESQIKSKAGQLLDNDPKRQGLVAPEIDQLQLLNSGGPFSNTLRQLGRGGAGVIPIMGQLAAAPVVAGAAGPAGLVAQALIAGGLYGARKGSEAITKSRANTLVEMLAKRSPEYESRVANLPPSDSSPQRAAVLRALLGAIQ